MKILVTGGAGYIGSHAVKKLVADGHEVVVLDDLSKGHLEAVDQGARFVEGNIGDWSKLTKLLGSGKTDAIMHFAGFIEVAESVKDPERYYSNNFARSLVLLKAAVDFGIKKFIFSSTAAVYGNPLRVPITEEHPLNPINPYGRTKMMFELALQDFNRAYGLDYTIFRYFNVAGASADHCIGEAHVPESHLIPNILAAAHDASKRIQIFGTDYPTPDGTCVRDYVHVEDLVDAHILALEDVGPNIFNLGSESGFSVREVVAACERVIGRSLPLVYKTRREGDPHTLVASSRKASAHLAWHPLYPDLDSIIAHAWRWHESHPAGYVHHPRSVDSSLQSSLH